MNGSNLEEVRQNYISHCDRIEKKLEVHRKNLADAISTRDATLISLYQKRVNNSLRSLRNYQSLIEFMREPYCEDVSERESIKIDFPKVIREIIPDNIPIVFHGNKNIGTILEIIETGGLFTPDQRGESETSFAIQIDVTYKNNISVSCAFAEPEINSFMPYGAIFAFLPLESEVEKVLATGENSEVYAGVAGVSFREEPSRLIGIITTKENKERIRAWCLKYHWDEQKVFTHDEFIFKCKEMFSVEREQHKSL